MSCQRDILIVSCVKLCFYMYGLMVRVRIRTLWSVVLRSIMHLPGRTFHVGCWLHYIECAYSFSGSNICLSSHCIFLSQISAQQTDRLDAAQRSEVGIHFTPCCYVCALHEWMMTFDSLTVVGKVGVVDMMIDEGAGKIIAMHNVISPYN